MLPPLLASMVSGAVAADQVAAVRFDTDFLRNDATQPVDISRFERGNAVDPGHYTLDLYVNRRWLGRQAVEVRPGPAYCFRREQLDGLGIAVERLPDNASTALAMADGSCVQLTRLVPQSHADFDLADLRADLSVPQAYLARGDTGYVPPSEWDRGVSAAFIDYNANAYRSETGGNSRTQYYAGLNGGVNLGDWRLRHNGSYSRDPDGDSDYNAVSSYLQRDLTGLKSQLTLGEYYTPADLFDSVPYSGVQLASDERMLPDSQRGFAPAIRGVAQSNARVTVRQGGNILYETSVAPGPFVIDELYGAGYAGDLEVTVSEADGREQRFTVPFASVAQLLRPGVSRYSVTAGEYRDQRLARTPQFAQATYQRGLSDRWTGYTGSFIAENYLAVQVGAATSSRFGAVALDITQSRANGLEPREGLGRSASGQSYRLSYSKLLEPTRTNLAVAAYRFSSEGYLGFADFAGMLDGNGGAWRYRQRNRVQVNLSQSLGGNRGSFYLSGSAQNYWNRDVGGDMSYQAGYSNSWRWVSLNLSASRTRDAGGDNQTRYLLSLSMPLGRAPRAPYLSSSVGRGSDGSQDLQLGLSGSLGERNALNYSLYSSRNRQDGRSSGNSGANVQYRSRLASVSANVSDGDDYRQLGLGLSGSLLAHRGGLNLSPDQGETKVLVEAKGASGAALENNPGAAIGANGYAFAAGLTPYRRNRVALDPRGLGQDVELEVSEQQVVPRFGSVVLLRYPTRSGRPLLLELRDEQGGRLPVGAEVLDGDAGVSLTLVGQGSRVFLRAERSEGELLVRWGEGPDRQCRVAYRVPPKEAEQQPLFHLRAVCQSQVTR
ncbi:fimbria/pilus outer membrane usher protein [Pseudomonas citronellolis]|uniref:fimbria/pilus outer membrane usher protein n=1 Tax=Pseudomonas citronellolis TaxID=53408 RepID=UPI0023E3DB65|nr:fimbria/pilus outer membrane usher protein [Pseudomonas citronellolis]MDF3931444.1 fimbrial biogenesis outer membrane usher protein [Pseudomonas citronellolis]